MWKEHYKIGVPLIDQQHEELFKRVAAFIQVVQKKGNWEEKLAKVKETMDFMQQYVIFHFDDEEKYMEEINYPHLEEHKNIHVQFKQGVFDYVERVNKEDFSEELVQEFGAKLMTWLIMHVAAKDQQIGNYVESQKEGKE